MITGVALTASAGMAFAQAAQNTTGTSGAVPPASATRVEEFVVTGSRIPQPNLTSTSPVTAVSSQELKLEGTTRVEDLINQLPQVVAAQGGNLSNGASGTATLDLRGLGAKRNLVLVDGRRLGPGDPTTPEADINFIPAGLIDRIDVLTGGASAVYGADAVAGVVNFIMKKDFEGLRLDANYGFYENGNTDTKSQAANNALGYHAPDSAIADGRTVDVSAIFGVNSPDGKGNVEGYLEYRYIAPVTEAARDYSFCSVSITGSKYACGGSSTSTFATIRTYNSAFKTTGVYQVDPTIPQHLDKYTGAANQLYNYAPENYYQRPDERYSGGFFAHYDITPHLTAYSQFMFMDDDFEGADRGVGRLRRHGRRPLQRPAAVPARDRSGLHEAGLHHRGHQHVDLQAQRGRRSTHRRPAAHRLSRHRWSSRRSQRKLALRRLRAILHHDPLERSDGLFLKRQAGQRAQRDPRSQWPGGLRQQPHRGGGWLRTLQHLDGGRCDFRQPSTTWRCLPKSPARLPNRW